MYKCIRFSSLVEARSRMYCWTCGDTVNSVLALASEYSQYRSLKILSVSLQLVESVLLCLLLLSPLGTLNLGLYQSSVLSFRASICLPTSNLYRLFFVLVLVLFPSSHISNMFLSFCLHCEHELGLLLSLKVGRESVSILSASIIFFKYISKNF